MSKISTNIPSVRVSDIPTQRFLDAVSLVLRTWNGETGNQLDKVVTYRDLTEDEELILAFEEALAKSSPSAAASSDTSIPVDLSNLVVTAGIASNILTWDGTGVGNYGWTYVYRNTVDDQGTASFIGSTISGTFTDSIGATNQTYYYWVRPVSKNRVTGSFNATAGTSATSAKVGAADLKPDVPLSNTYVSTGNTISSAGLVTLAHGLGVVPYNIVLSIKCVTAEHGYSTGDVVILPVGADMSIKVDSTNIYIRYGSAVNPLTGINATTGASVTFTNANWTLEVRAWV